MEENEKKDLSSIFDDNPQKGEEDDMGAIFTEDSLENEKKVEVEIEKKLEENNKKEKLKKKYKETPVAAEKKTKDKSKKKITIIVAIVVAIIAIIIAVIVTIFLLKRTEIDLSKCFTVKYEGHNGYAKASVEVNEDAIEKQIDDDKKARAFINELEIETEDTSKLSNGDEITIKVKISSDCLKENKLELKEETIKVKVSGLEELQEVDLTKYIEITYLGEYATATLSSEKLEEDFGEEIASKLMNKIFLYIEDSQNLNKGDKAKVKIEVDDEDYLKENGIKLKSKTAEVEVKETKNEYNPNGQTKYISSTSEIDQLVKYDLETIFTDKAYTKSYEDYTESSDNMKYCIRENTDYKNVNLDSYDVGMDLMERIPELSSMYLLTKKSDTNVNEENIIMAIVKVPFTSLTAGKTYNWYITIQLNNVSLNTYGGVNENTNYSIMVKNGNSEEAAYQEYIKNKENDYNVEKISI